VQAATAVVPSPLGEKVSEGRMRGLQILTSPSCIMKDSPARKDLRALDPCDKHRDEGGEVGGSPERPFNHPHKELKDEPGAASGRQYDYQP